MWEVFKEYWLSLYRDIPGSVYAGMLVVFLLAVVLIMACRVWRNVIKNIIWALFAEYLFLIYCSTVIFRDTGKEIGYNILPFWSYEVILSGEDYRLLPENVMNVVVFVPVGVLLGTAFRSMTWWKALLIGGAISVSIEVMQFVLKRGFAEVDDVMHNTVGCVIGYGVWMVCRCLFVTRGRERE